jgi:hypothetical protein
MKGQVSIEYLMMVTLIISLAFIIFLILMALAGLANYLAAKIIDISVSLFVSILCA